MSVCDVRDALTKVFEECDTDKSGFIDAKEVETALRKCTQTQECKEKWDDARIKQETDRFLSHADKNKDRKVSQQEFLDHYAPLLSKQKDSAEEKHHSGDGHLAKSNVEEKPTSGDGHLAKGNAEEKRPDQAHHSGDGHLAKGKAEEKHHSGGGHLTKGNAEEKRPDQAQHHSGDGHLTK